MIKVQFGTYQIKNGDHISSDIYQQPLGLSWENQAQTLYSIFIIGQRGTARVLHYAIINIPGPDLTRGNTLAGYLPLTSNSDRYNIYLYRQSYPIIIKTIPNRSAFNLDQMVAENALILDEMIYFLTRLPLNSVIPALGKNGLLSPLPVSPTKYFKPQPSQELKPLKPKTILHVYPGTVKGTAIKSGYFKDSNALSEGNQKYCRCVLHLMGKQNKGCLENKAWFKDVDGKRCYNPYSVCAKSTRHSNRQCGKNYDWSGIPDNELEGYANINHVSVPSPYDRTQMINNILAWKKSKYKN